MQLSRNFRLEEFIRSETARLRGIDNSPPPDILASLRVTALGCEQVRAAIGRPLRIMSGYRCPALNAAVGGSKTSSHLTGLAADLSAPGLTAMGLAQAIRDSRIMFDQLILETSRGVVHVGFGPLLRRQVMTQAGAAGSSFAAGLVG